MKIFNQLKQTTPAIIHANGVWHESVKNILKKINLEYKQGDKFECFFYKNEEITEKTNIFNFNDTNTTLRDDIAVYTWNNKKFRNKWIFEIVCDINKIKYTNLITSDTFKTIDKLKTINLETKKLKNSKIKYFFCADSKDVFFTTHPNVFVENFLINNGRKMMICAETNNYPDNIISKEKNNPSPFKFLNSGAYISEINFLEKWTDYCIANLEEFSHKYFNDQHCLDQALFKQAYNLFHSECTLDVNSDLFLCLYGCESHWIEFGL